MYGEDLDGGWTAMDDYLLRVPGQPLMDHYQLRVPAGTMVDGAVAELSRDDRGIITAQIRIPAPAAQVTMTHDVWGFDLGPAPQPEGQP